MGSCPPETDLKVFKSGIRRHHGMWAMLDTSEVNARFPVLQALGAKFFKNHPVRFQCFYNNGADRLDFKIFSVRSLQALEICFVSEYEDYWCDDDITKPPSSYGPSSSSSSS